MNKKHPTSGLPPEHRADPGLEYPQDRSLEYGRLPPEYGQRTSPPGAEEKKPRRLSRWLAIPAVLLVSILSLQGTKLLPASQEPAAEAPEPPPTLPVETVEPIPETPRGSVILDVQYAVREGDLVKYQYVVYTPEPSLDATQEQIDAYEGPIWPVSVYAQVSDEGGSAVHPETDPDVWENDGHPYEEYVINAAGLEGDLTLTLRAVYTERGEERQSVAVIPVSPEMETRAELIPLGGSRIAFTAYLKPPSGDASDYDFRVDVIGQLVYEDGGDEAEGLSLTSDPSELPVEYDPENGFTVHYEGGSALGSIPDSAELSVVVMLEDQNTGNSYSIESNRVRASSVLRLSAELKLARGGYADFTAFVRIPEGDDHAYDFSVEEMSLNCVKPGEHDLTLPLGRDPQDAEITGSNETGYTVRYLGQSSFVSLEGNYYCSGYLRLIDNSTGKTYEVESPGVWSIDAANNLPEFPLEGNVVITVYNDTDTYMVPSRVEYDGWVTLLAAEAFSMEDFTEYELPTPVAPRGYEFQGWVIHVNNPFDLGSEEDLFDIYGGDPPADILTTPDRYAFPVDTILTREDLAHVPPDEEGNRYVNVHAVWIKTRPDRELLYLNDGMGNLTAYDMDVPLASEGYLYLCRYPVPEQEGWIFNGWYDNDGNRVDLLVCYFSFTPMLYNEDGDFIGYDWNTTQPVFLNAGWTLDTENPP